MVYGSVVNLRKRRISRQKQGENNGVTLHEDCSTPHAEAVKGEFGGLDVVIVPDGIPSCGARSGAAFR